MNAENSTTVHQLVDHLFRHEAGKMVSVLTRLFGMHNLDLAEDVVQDTLQQALLDWSLGHIPDNPAAWLMVVAKRKAINRLKRERHIRRFPADAEPFIKSDWTLSYTLDRIFLENEIKDSQLRMMFTCCHPRLPIESQIALTLKTLCGFTVMEIALALLTQEATINKRLYRAKEKIRKDNIQFEVPEGKALHERLDAVHLTIYLLFNEGYHSSTSDGVIRNDLCLEAMRLLTLLTGKPMAGHPKTHALLALMCFHVARFEARMDSKGCLVILQDQDRSLWDKNLISRGLEFLSCSSEAHELSEYHLEAGIAAQHCMAGNFEETNWKTILTLYEHLEKIKPSPVILLNKAIILGILRGPEKAIGLMHLLENNKALSGYYLLPATLGVFYLQCGNKEKAKSYFLIAKNLTSSKAENELLDRKLSTCC